MSSTRTPGGLRARQKEHTRALLLAAAIDVFSEIGYGAATVAQVADAAGTSRPTFYQYFASKAEIALELMHDLSAHTEKVFGELYALEPLTLDGVRAWVARAIELWDPMNSRLAIVNEAVILEPEVRVGRAAGARSTIDHVAAFLRRRRPDLSLTDARLHACHLLAEFQVLHLTSLLDMPATAPVTVNALADSWWAVIGSTQAR